MLDLGIVFLFIWFLINLSFQFISILRLIHFLQSTVWIKVLQIAVILALSLFYIYDVFLMLFYFWGAPSYEMTIFTWTWQKESNYINQYDSTTILGDGWHKVWTNSFSFCIFKKEGIKGDQNLMDQLQFSFTISLISRFLWTICLFLSMIYFQSSNDKSNDLNRRMSYRSNVINQLNQT